MPSTNIQSPFLQTHLDQFKDYWGKDHSHEIISFQGKHWLLKNGGHRTEEKNLNYLAYLLGKNWLNIPEVLIPSEEQLKALKKYAHFKKDLKINQDTFLVRLVQDYQDNEISIKDLDYAMAAEIAFSVWIGRRDAHSCNRAFKNNIPMFFDFGIAFGFETEDFFRAGPDAGYANNWRFEKIKDNQVIDLVGLRGLEQASGLAMISIISRNNFQMALVEIVAKIKAISSESISQYAILAGFNNERSADIVKYLERRTFNLDENLKVALAILDQDI